MGIVLKLAYDVQADAQVVDAPGAARDRGFARMKLSGRIAVQGADLEGLFEDAAEVNEPVGFADITRNWAMPRLAWAARWRGATCALGGRSLSPTPRWYPENGSISLNPW